MLFSKLRTQNIVYGMSENLAKFWMFVAGVVIVINLFLILTLMQMAPKLQMIAQILTVSPMQSNQLLQTEPFSGKTGDRELLDETLVRYYIEMRYTSFPDKEEMKDRWGNSGPIARLSIPDVYESFSQKLNERIEAVSTAHRTTSVDILSVSRLDNIFTVEFDVYSYAQDNITSFRKVAVVIIGYNASRQFFNKEGYSNPFGLIIHSYKESEKKG